MIGRINHIAIAVPDVTAAAQHWQTMLGATVSAVQTLPEHGVRIVFVSAPNGKVELMEPIDAQSPIAHIDGSELRPYTSTAMPFSISSPAVSAKSCAGIIPTPTITKSKRSTLPSLNCALVTLPS